MQRTYCILHIIIKKIQQSTACPIIFVEFFMITIVFSFSHFLKLLRAYFILSLHPPSPPPHTTYFILKRTHGPGRSELGARAASPWSFFPSSDYCIRIFSNKSIFEPHHIKSYHFLLCHRLGVWYSHLSSKKIDTEFNTREANVQEETRAPNRGFVSVFTELTRYYPLGERKENTR